MVATTTFGFGSHHDRNLSGSDIIPSRGIAPLTPTSSDCFSVTSDSDGLDSSVASEMAPVRRDPALLIERLENSLGRRRMGKRKMRRALNESALAALVEGHEEPPSVVMRPYHSAFKQLLSCPINMMVWYHFTNMSEEDQREFLANPKQRNRGTEKPLTKISSSAEAVSRPASQAAAGVDSRSVHPAALPNTTSRTSTHGQMKKDSLPAFSDPFLTKDDEHQPFELPRRLPDVSSEQSPSHSATTDTFSGETDGTQPPTRRREYCRTSSTVRDSNAPTLSDLDLPCSDNDISSSSSFDLLDESDTDNEIDEFMLLGQ